jgi:hypothetical protein
VNVNEAVDRPVGVGASDDRQDREQHDLWQSIKLALTRRGSSISASKSTNGLNDAMATPSAAVPCSE